MVGADDEVGVSDGGVQVGHGPLDPGQPPGLGLQLPVDGRAGAGEGEEPVPFDRRLALTAFVALATCSSIPRRVRRPRSCLHWW